MSDFHHRKAYQSMLPFCGLMPDLVGIPESVGAFPLTD